jgi:glycosyltransferase involved in cell wall biosynthesis
VKLSAVVITRNEETNIARCLKSLDFCDEIVIVDAQSSDRTREIAAAYTDRIIVRPWSGYTAQRNYAASLAKNDWILSIDADEEVSPELKRELTTLTSERPPHTAFFISRRNIHLGRWIRHGGWYPNRLVRLFQRSAGSWVGEELHEKWETSGSYGKLDGDLIHYSFTNLADQVARNNQYSTLGAIRLQKLGKRFSFFKLGTKTFSKFVETYIVKLGFLDGYPGLIISVSAAYSVFLKWAKLWELEKCRSHQPIE